MPPTPLRVMIADDERPARRFLASVLQSCGGVEIVGEAGSGEEAIAVIECTRPQLALLDLQMPGLGGLDVVRRLPPGLLPVIAFVTAFDDFAIDAWSGGGISIASRSGGGKRSSSSPSARWPSCPPTASCCT